MRRKITLFVFTCLIARCYSQVTKCDVDDPKGILGWDTAIIVTDPIDDTGVLNLEFTYRGDFQVTADTEEEGAKYIDVTADGSTWSIKTNDYFTNNYEEDQRDLAAASSLTIFRTLSITCDGTTYTLNINLYVQDTNNHSPTFTQDIYTYTMPMPLVPNIDLTNFGDIEIIAEDIDFSNTKMTFTVDPPEQFALDFKALPSRQYHAVLKVKQYVRYDKDLTLTITATDETDPFNNGTATVVIKKDTQFSQPDVPTFSELIYAFTYSNDGGNPAITPDDPSKEIVVTTSDSDQTEVSLSDETYFKAEYDKTKNIVAISVTDTPVESASESMMTLTLTVKLGSESSESAIIVKLPSNVVVIIPKFTAPYYTATYSVDGDGNPSLTLDAGQEIAITQQASNLQINLEGAYPDNFDIQCDDEGKCNLQLKAPLEDTVLTSEKEIILVLEASKEDTAATSTATVIISLPLLETLDAPEFTENVYVAPYVVDEETGEITINPDNPIQIKGETNLTGFELIPDGENVDHFAFIKKEDHWDVTNSKPLPDETLKNDVSILLNLKVTKLGVSVPGLAGLVIQLPKSTDPEILSFTQVAYIANYTVVTGNNNDVLDITNGPVKFDGVDDASTVKPDVVEDEYKDYFSITPETDGWTIAMLKDFSSEITDQISLTVTLKATLDDRSGECALVISLPKKVSPASFQFEFPTYRAEYEQDQDGNYKVSFEKSITLTGDAKDVTVDIDGDYATYFVETKTGNTVSIELNKDLPDDVLDKVAITLDIVASKSNEKATSTAVINLPRKVVPSSFYFDSGVYTGTYNEDDTFALDSDQKISLKGDIDHTATFAANGDYAGYFAVSYDGEEITVTLTKPLPSEVVEEKITIPVGIVATREGVDTPTTLVVKLPKNSAPATFYFEHSVYTVQYIDDDDSLVQPDINIEGDSDNKASVKLISSDYAKYFDAGYTNGAVKLTVKEPITDEIIAEKGAITVDLEATSPSDEVATATVVIELPKRNTAATFYFDSTIYEASYNDDGVTVNGSITLTGDSDSTATVEVQGEYADDFTVTYTDNTVELSLTKTLPSDVLDTYAAITVDIVATKGSETATTTVVITLPKKIVPASFSFNSTHYVGDYKVDDNGNTLAVSAISLKGETENVKVTLEGEYSDHFSVGYASGNVNISLKEPLDSDILDTKSAIPLDLKAAKADETVITTLVITLPKEASVGDSEDDKTGLIAAVAVLAVLLVASLVGSAVFYYFKFRRGSSYNDIDEGRPSERFRKNSTTDSKKVEHPTRRATGVIKYPLEEVAENGETPTEEMEPNLEKRKSVQFDTINIDELEIEKPEDDDNDFMGDSEAEDGDDTRRTSRV